MNFYRELTFDEKILYESLFRNDECRYIPEVIDEQSTNSCDYHAMTHAHTEVLGVFCDNTAISDQELREILTIGLSEWRKRCLNADCISCSWYGQQENPCEICNDCYDIFTEK